MKTQNGRRQFLKSAVATGGCLAGIGDLAFLHGLPAVSAAESQLPADTVRFTPEIEPLVRLIEDTPRAQLLERVADKLRDGLGYRQLLAALLLAGVRNVQPRPSVGFKFHAVLVVNSAHLASLSSPDQDRWLPIFWALDNFKSSQARDVREGNWTMSAVNEATIPTAEQARGVLIDSLESWDEEATDSAVAGLCRAAGANDLFAIFSRYGVRDFRSIGHKAIFVANSWRTLQCIGWRYSEPVLRSLAYALLNHEGEPNPADSDLSADRPWRKNLERVNRINSQWLGGTLDAQATTDMIRTLRSGSADDSSKLVVELLNRGVAPQSVFDGLLAAAGELLMRQPGIVALHAVTTTNAMHYLFTASDDHETRKLILLQNAAFLPLFREEMKNLGDVGNQKIDEIEAKTPDVNDDPIREVFASLKQDSATASAKVLGFLQDGGDPQQFINAARRLIFLKGTDSHDYKFSSAVLEDYYHTSPQWRNHYLAASINRLRGSTEPDNQLVKRTRAALGVS